MRSIRHKEQTPVIWKNEHYELDDDRERLDMERISGWIRNAYWAVGRTHQQVLDSWRGSAVVFGLYHDATQVGCARVVSDLVTTAYLADVFIAPNHRGRGAGTWMMESILSHPDFQTTRWLLHTRDAHALYRRVGFVDVGERVMERPRR
jgi:GNAT superfamily N-acetyltransferase